MKTENMKEKQLKVIYTRCEKCIHNNVCKMVGEPERMAEEYNKESYTDYDDKMCISFECTEFKEDINYRRRMPTK